jgi:vacuolar-type H+-ATPase subunit I/STV1
VLVVRPYGYYFFTFAHQECNDSERNRILNSIPSSSCSDNHLVSGGVRNKHQEHIATAENALETLNDVRSLLRDDLKKVCNEIAELAKKRKGKNVAASLEKLEIRKVDLERELTKLGVEVLDDDDDDNNDTDETDDT